MSSINDFTFPIGYLNFHKDKTMNFQLNRWHSFGFADYDDLIKVAKRISNFDDWTTELVKLAEFAEKENRLFNAAFYYRAAEFYIQPNLPEKHVLYAKFKTIMKDIVAENGIEMIDVPYKSGYLPCYRKKVEGIEAKGTILIHGGFDSFIEEFYTVLSYFNSKGYEVVVFEGPGQGDARRKHELAFDYKWEQPVKAVLDFFELDDVTLLGVSLGGYLCFRAAAFEPRVKRVIASSIAYDYTDFPPKILQPIVDLFYNRFTNYTNKATLKEMKKGGVKGWYFSNLMYMQKAQKPIDAIQYLTKMTADELHCDKIAQDVLILTGRDDHAAPFKMHKKQVDALINAKSVTDKVFYKDSHASHHCQIGNMKLNLDTMINWIESV